MTDLGERDSFYAWYCSSIIPEGEREIVCVGLKRIGTAVEKVLVRLIPTFFVLREPADSLATAAIIYRNEDRLTQKKSTIEPGNPRPHINGC